MASCYVHLWTMTGALQLSGLNSISEVAAMVIFKGMPLQLGALVYKWVKGLHLEN